MSWNWQESDWPKFAWNQRRLALAEQEFLIGGGIFVGAIKHLGEEGRNQLTVEAMSTEALTTSEIEGEMLDRGSVQSSIQRQLGLTADNRRAGPAERGVSEMMGPLDPASRSLAFGAIQITVRLYKTFSEPLSGKMGHRFSENSF